MSHNQYPKTNCPLSGKLCPNKKNLKITELNKGDTFTFGICKECCQKWKDTCSNKKLTPVHRPEQPSFLDTIKSLTDSILKPKLDQPLTPIAIHKLPADVPMDIEMLQDILFGKDTALQPSIKCSSCNTTLEEMSKQDRISCPQCYETFKKQLLPLIRKYHNSVKHVGKIPKNWENNKIKELFSPEEVLKDKIASLKKIQKDAISKENYEEAGKLKKEIASLEKELSSLAHFPASNEKSDSSSSHDDPLPPKIDEDQ